MDFEPRSNEEDEEIPELNYSLQKENVLKEQSFPAILSVSCPFYFFRRARDQRKLSRARVK
jgi:hypothetical protein